MLIKPPDDIKECDVTPLDVYLERRRFLQSALTAAGAVAAAVMTPGALSAGAGLSFNPSAIAAPGAATTAFEDVTGYNNFYEFGVGKEDPARYAHSLRTDPWSVVVEGEVERPGRYILEDILRPHALQERIYRLRCVEAWSMVIPWIGFPLGDFIRRLGPTSRARYVWFETLHDPEQMPGQRRRVLKWPYREGLRMDEALHPLTLLAVGLYGQVLPNQNGAPLRLVVPWKYGFKSIKSIVKIGFGATRPFTTWSDVAPRDYGFFANVNPEVSQSRWSQRRERRIGELRRRDTLLFNGYAEQVASLYRGMDLQRFF